MANLRKRINANCKGCTYDCKAPGTWRQQITLCSVFRCPMWGVRPTSQTEISNSVLEFYGITPGTLEEELTELKRKHEEEMTKRYPSVCKTSTTARKQERGPVSASEPISRGGVK